MWIGIHPENNVSIVTEEFPVESRDKLHNARPDLVVFLNGIPFGVIECKAPQISVEQAVEQTVRNQQRDVYSPAFTKFAQIVMATNKNAVNTPPPARQRSSGQFGKSRIPLSLGRLWSVTCLEKRPPSRIAAWSLSSIPAEYWS